MASTPAPFEPRELQQASSASKNQSYPRKAQGELQATDIYQCTKESLIPKTSAQAPFEQPSGSASCVPLSLLHLYVLEGSRNRFTPNAYASFLLR
mmetsp:Transcript_29443/g.62046  ORF Transcript_29443/g.62046 Transcript_29443/m.62046 type:complete len:95 (-) Transcript_29443:742-1026(-)